MCLCLKNRGVGGWREESNVMQIRVCHSLRFHHCFIPPPPPPFLFLVHIVVIFSSRCWALWASCKYHRGIQCIRNIFRLLFHPQKRTYNSNNTAATRTKDNNNTQLYVPFSSAETVSWLSRTSSAVCILGGDEVWPKRHQHSSWTRKQWWVWALSDSIAISSDGCG